MEDGPATVARRARRAGEPIRAGDYFTVAAYNRLGDHLPWETPTSLFSAERQLADASICYRLGDSPEWSENRCRQGMLLAETTIERLTEEFESPLLELEKGACYEYIADLKTISDRRDATAELAAAKTNYVEAGENTSTGDEFTLIDVEELNDYSIALFNQLIAVTGAGLDPVDQWDGELLLSEWIEYKQRHLSDLIDNLLDTGIEAYSDSS